MEATIRSWGSDLVLRVFLISLYSCLGTYAVVHKVLFIAHLQTLVLWLRGWINLAVLLCIMGFFVLSFLSISWQRGMLGVVGWLVRRLVRLTVLVMLDLFVLLLRLLYAPFSPGPVGDRVVDATTNFFERFGTALIRP